MTVKLSKIAQIALTVSDVDTALGFYHFLLGLALLYRAGPNLAYVS